MIKILHVLEATTGGTRTHLRHIAKNLDRERFRMAVACSSERDRNFRSDLARLREADITVHEIPMCREIRPLADVVSLVRLCRVIRENDYDIVHTHSSKAGVLGRLAAELCSRAKIVHTPHTFAFMHDAEFGPLRRALFAFVERALGRCTDRLIVLSREEREMAVRRRIVPSRRISLQHNGVASNHRPDAERVRRLLGDLQVDGCDGLIGTAGLLSRAKGQRYLLSALPVILQEFPSVRCLIVGDGELRDELARQARRDGVASRVVFTGHVESCEDLLSVLDVFVLPSLWEGMPYAILEAMSLGKPVVATRVGGCKDVVVDGETGLLVDARDPGSLAGAIRRLLRDSEERRRMGERGQRRAREMFGLDRMIAGLQGIYEELATHGALNGAATPRLADDPLGHGGTWQ
jgi:glycosyltransferase involved in cell wall biosynthesis